MTSSMRPRASRTRRDPHEAGAERASLVIQTSYLGDLVLTTPLIEALAARGPVDVVTTPAAAPILANHPGVRAVIPYDKRGSARGLPGLWRAAHALRARYVAAALNDKTGDRAMPTAYLAQGSTRSAALALLAGCRERIGFATSAGRGLYTRRVPFQADLHHAERLWMLAADSNTVPPPEARRPRLYPGPDDIAAVDQLLRVIGEHDEPIIAVAPGSAWATKRWPYYPALSTMLASRGWVAVVGGPGDQGLASEIVSAAGRHRGRVIDATGRLTPLATAALLGRCVALVANDSAPQHLASAMGTPTLTIYGPTVPAFGFGPLAPRHEVAGHLGLTCRPCDRHGPRRCPLGHWRCMRELHVADIAQIIAQLTAAPHLS
jgi:heptosyltransferase II